jgi:hypothetical protein
VTGGRAVGASIDLAGGICPDALLFGEAPARIVISVSRKDTDTMLRIAESLSCPAGVIGAVGGSRLRIGGWIDVDAGAAADAWRGALDRLMGD